MLAKAQSPVTRTVITHLLRPAAPAVVGLLVLLAASPSAAAVETTTAASGETAQTTSSTGTGTTASSEATSGSESGSGASSPPPAEGTTTPTPPAEGTSTPPSAEPTPPPAETTTPPTGNNPPPAEGSSAPTESKQSQELSNGTQNPSPPAEADPVGKLETPAHSPGMEHERAFEASTGTSAAPNVAGAAAGNSEGGPPPTGPTGSEVVNLAGPSAASGSSAPLSPEAAKIVQRDEQRSCQLSLLGAPATAHCVAAWSGVAPARQAAATVPDDSAVASVLVAATAAGNGNGGHGSGGNGPISPSPVPSPGGATGGGVASGAGGGGVGLAGFLTLIGLTLLAAPRALRHLRLSCRPYRTAFFVLIPERPG